MDEWSEHNLSGSASNRSADTSGLAIKRRNVPVLERHDIGSAIAGVHIVPLARIPDERGTILHMLRRTDPHFIEFGEIYFSTVYAGAIKAWHLHKVMTLNYACPHGRIKLVLFDDRPSSSTRGQLMEVFLGPDQYSLVQIPPNVWNGFKGMGHNYSIVANCATHPHDPTMSVRLDPFDQRIPYDWAMKHR
jgi:dTDP-4-dehydrorhamnose 3,5-epimerase